MKTIRFCIVLALFGSLTAQAGSEKFSKKGYIQNDMGEKCSYTQKVNPTENYFHKALTAVTGTIVFDDPQCMKDSGVGLDTNKMMINNVIAKWYGQSDSRFETRASELYPTSFLQVRGQCMQSTLYKKVGVAVDYIVRKDSITKVRHANVVKGCSYTNT